MTGNRLTQFIKDIADGLRSRQIPHITGHLRDTYRGPVGADGLRAVGRGHSGTDASAAQQVERTANDTGPAGHEKAEQPGPGALPDRGAHPGDRRDTPAIVADELERIHLSGVQARWENLSGVESPRREFEAWIRSPTAGPLPELGPDSGFNCWEMLSWAGARTNSLSHADLHRMYAPLTEFRRSGVGPVDLPIRQELCPGGVSRYIRGDATGPQPQRGDVIMWGDADHVTVATGRIAQDGSPEVYSFWPPPKHTPVMDWSTGDWSSSVIDAVQVTSLDVLDARVSPSYLSSPREIVFGRGPW